MNERISKHEHRPHLPETLSPAQSESLVKQEKRHEDEPLRSVEAAKNGNPIAVRPIEPATAVDTPARLIDQETTAVENILAEGMESFFLHLSPLKQLEFKSTGEETASKIISALRNKTTRIKDIVRLIIDWLKNLPAINRFFLEQEAKIKADKIIERYRS